MVLGGNRSIFGVASDGREVYTVRLATERIEVEILTFGAIIRDIVFDGRSTVLGCDTLRDYETRSPYFGAIVGRCANRIARGRLELDGETHQLTLNENGRHHLHGGAPGFSRRNWSLVDHDARSVTLRLVSEDGDQGYPGRVEATCRYALVGPAEVEFALEATTDRPTVVNLANHTYFNLTGEDVVDDHTVRIAAARHLPVDDELIPTGAIDPVEGTRFDFRQPRRIGAERYDTPFVLDGGKTPHPRPVATVLGVNGVRLDIATTQPNIQFYTGQQTAPGTPGRDGRRYGPGAGLCLETQGFPDAPNHPNFPSIALLPGETYRQVTRFAFSEA